MAGNRESRLDKLKSQLAAHVVHFDKESTKHKNLHRRLQISIFSLLALSTSLAGVAAAFSYYGRILNLIIVATTAVAGLLTSIAGMRKSAELWILERGSYHALKDLMEELEFQTAESDRTPDLDDYFNRMRSIISAAEQKWHLQAKQSEKKAAEQKDPPELRSVPD